jgi:sugar-phosphatase
MPVSSFERRFAAILVDMDGTILTSIAAAERAWSTWALDRGIEPSSFLSTIHGLQAAEAIRRLGRPDLDPDREAAAVTSLEIADVEGVESIPGAIAFLDALPLDRWALVTSAPRLLATRRLKAAGFSLPPVMVTAEDVPRGKPAADCFLLAASRLGTVAADCLVFEDSAAGVAAAEAAGAAVIVITAAHRHPMSTSHPTVPSFSGLTATIARDGSLQVDVLEARDV